MQAITTKEKINLSHAKAIRRARELLKVTRTELAMRLGVTSKAIEKYENGRAILDHEKLENIIRALNLDFESYQKIRKGKGCGLKQKFKTVFSNSQRRSYRRVITKEVRVLKILRQMKNLTQDQASAVCGYSRPTIGHIENGRIEVPYSRLCYIVNSYGHDIKEFEKLMQEENLRDEIIEGCSNKLLLLSENNLMLVQNMIDSLISSKF